MDKWIAKHYGNEIPLKIKGSKNIVIATAADASQKVSETKKQKGQFLPLFFFWQWKHTTHSVINEKFFASSFSSDFISYAKSKHLEEKLGTATLQLSVDNNPSDFELHEDGKLIFLLLAYIGSESIYISPSKKELSFGYKVLNGDVVVKEGALVIPNPNKLVSHKGGLQPLRKMTWEYLSGTDANVKAISRALVDELMTVL